MGTGCRANPANQRLCLLLLNPGSRRRRDSSVHASAPVSAGKAEKGLTFDMEGKTNVPSSSPEQTHPPLPPWRCAACRGLRLELRLAARDVM
ncbi:hypothetical protein SKAU_G00396540 [Synaphobranchus kaupii]|uniref:Uncharacterized protein n=1 Tax=Synaphobranchus kaupii TaxID=118154 RepID=A0A9Q1ECK3_SYNKA|nr:hypothetical protein SKAU_G00396540 [Synaphobranchus kaupii]